MLHTLVMIRASLDIAGLAVVCCLIIVNSILSGARH